MRGSMSSSLQLIARSEAIQAPKQQLHNRNRVPVGAVNTGAAVSTGSTLRASAPLARHSMSSAEAASPAPFMSGTSRTRSSSISHSLRGQALRLIDGEIAGLKCCRDTWPASRAGCTPL